VRLCLALVAVVLVVACAFSSMAGAAEISAVPTMECAGVYVKHPKGPNDAKLKVQWREAGAETWRPAFRLTRYDANHLATSIFGLKSGAKYEVKVEGVGEPATTGFTTRPDFSLPKPRRVVTLEAGASIQAAVGSASAGTEIRIPPGTYSGGITITKSGTADAPIVLRGMVPEGEPAKKTWERTDLPVVDCRAGAATGIDIRGASHVVIDGICIKDAKDFGIRLSGAKACVIQKCQIYDTRGRWTANLHVAGRDSGHHLIQDNHIADMDHPDPKTYIGADSGTSMPFNYKDPGSRRFTEFGYRADTPGPRTILRRNKVESFMNGVDPAFRGEPGKFTPAHEDVLAKWQGHDIDIYDNTIYHCADGMELDGVGVNIRIFSNRFEKCNQCVTFAPVAPGPYFCVRNLMLDIRWGVLKLNTGMRAGRLNRNVYFFHNTCNAPEHKRAGIVLVYGGAPSRNIVFRNNIFSSGGKVIDFSRRTTHKVDMDYNIWHSSLKTSRRPVFCGFGGGGFDRFRQVLTQVTGHPGEPHGMEADPRLNDDSALGEGSPAVDKAVIIPGINEAGFKGNAPDIGAVETR